MKPDGYNPLRWNCTERGCFNVKRRPKIETFADCFPGRISFGDVDGIVEIAGQGLMLEWKSEPLQIPSGQKIMYEELSSNGVITVLCLAGNAETMEVTHRKIFFLGKSEDWVPSTIEEAKDAIRRWVKWSQGIGEWRRDYDKGLAKAALK